MLWISCPPRCKHLVHSLSPRLLFENTSVKSVKSACQSAESAKSAFQDGDLILRCWALWIGCPPRCKHLVHSLSPRLPFGKYVCEIGEICVSIRGICEICVS